MDKDDIQMLTAMYFGMVATSANSNGLSLEQCWTRAKQLAVYAQSQNDGQNPQAPLRVR